jgi:hypothetical protein
MAGIFAATRLKAIFGEQIDVVYMHAAERNSLLSPQCLKFEHPATITLKSRLVRKMKEGQFGGEDGPCFAPQAVRFPFELRPLQILKRSFKVPPATDGCISPTS